MDPIITELSLTTDSSSLGQALLLWSATADPAIVSFGQDEGTVAGGQYTIVFPSEGQNGSVQMSFEGDGGTSVVTVNFPASPIVSPKARIAAVAMAAQDPDSGGGLNVAGSDVTVAWEYLGTGSIQGSFATPLFGHPKSSFPVSAYQGEGTLRGLVGSEPLPTGLIFGSIEAGSSMVVKFSVVGPTPNSSLAATVETVTRETA